MCKRGLHGVVQYEPTIEELRHKYEVAMKEKMLVRLEKERLQARTEALEAQVMHLHWQPKWQDGVDLQAASLHLDTFQGSAHVEAV